MYQAKQPTEDFLRQLEQLKIEKLKLEDQVKRLEEEKEDIKRSFVDKNEQVISIDDCYISGQFFFMGLFLILVDITSTHERRN